MAAVKKNDTIFFLIASALVIYGIFILASASLGMAARSELTPYHLLVKQLVQGVGLGLICAAIAHFINYSFWRKTALILFLASFALTLVVLVPGIGFSHGGAQRWLDIGFFSFQPSELLKFSFVIYLSSWLSKRKREEISSFKGGMLPFLILVGFAAILLIFQPDMSTLGVIALSSLALFWMAGAKHLQVAAIIILGIGFVYGMTHLPNFSYMGHRLLSFTNPDADPLGTGYQLAQAKTAIGSGGLFGAGYGQGLAKYNVLPEPVGDSIFAVLGEELGFIGTGLLILLYFIFLLKCFNIALKAKDNFGRYLAAGLGVIIVTQALINMYSMVGLLPITGLPLVFISQGGSSLAIALAQTGVISNIAKKAN